MALTLDDLYASPDHYLHSIDGDAAIFLPMDRAAYHRSIFLDARISPAAGGSMRLPLAALGGAGRGAATGWIFHVAHCGSTLLARALDDVAGNLVLREPLALRQVAVAQDRSTLGIVTAMLAKRYRRALPTIVKANVPVNFILGDIAASDPTARAIFLHLSLRDYLLAILRDEDHRAWLRRVTTLLAPRLDLAGAVADAERAAALWMAQMRAFATAATMLPEARSLDAERFFADPAAVLVRSAEVLQVTLSADDAAARIAGPLFTTYSKNPGVAFDNAVRLARRNEAAQAIGNDLDLAERWLEPRAGAVTDAITTLRAIDLLR